MTLSTIQHRIVETATHPGIPVGIACGLVSAVFYTLANIALRQSVSVDAFFVAAMKSVPTLFFLTPYLLAIKASGRPIVNHPHLVPRFIAVSLIGQVAGNGSFQLALGSIGLAASVPITLGSLLIGSAIIGRWILGETVRRRTAIAIAILLIAVLILTQSGEPVEFDSVADGGLATEIPDQSAVDLVAPVGWDRLIGAMYAIVSGLSFALFSSTMRLSMKQGMQSATAMWISGAVGTFALLSIVAARSGLDTLAGVPGTIWFSMLMAGVFNFVAFVAITTAMRVLPIVAVHLLNASQVAMAATAGVILFGERLTLTLIAGIALTLVGLIVLAAKRPTAAT